MEIDLLLKLLLVLAGIGGFLVSRRIHKDKKKGKPFVCPLKFDCHKVTSSAYSKLFGIPLEYYGMLYYGIIIVSYSLFTFAPHLAPWYFNESVIVLSIVAFVFSLFLTWVQAVRIKEWCSWCLVSAFISVSILVLTIILYLVPVS